MLRRFEELGSTRQVMLGLRREQVALPVTRHGKDGRDTEWASPNYTRVHAIITNPFYAGAYVFGRTESRTTIVDGPHQTDLRPRAALDQWRGRDPGPPSGIP